LAILRFAKNLNIRLRTKEHFDTSADNRVRVRKYYVNLIHFILLQFPRSLSSSENVAFSYPIRYATGPSTHGHAESLGRKEARHPLKGDGRADFASGHICYLATHGLTMHI
jgi:hypothetical protein